MEKKIGIASDHAGYEMKEFLVGYLAALAAAITMRKSKTNSRN